MDIKENETFDDYENSTFISGSYSYNFVIYTWPELYKTIDEINRKYVLFVVLLVSVVGNSLIVLVLSSKKNRNNSTAVYLLSLAASDLTITCFMFLHWLDIFGLLYISTLARRLHFILFDVGLYTNSWAMCLISAERAISVWRPHKVKIFCTTNLARGMTIGLWLLFVSVFSLYNQILIAKRNYFGEMKCAILQENFPIVDAHDIAGVFVQFLIPFVLILCSTILILVILYKKSLTKSKSVVQKNLLVTKNLLLINFAFIIFVTPAMVMEALDTYQQRQASNTYEQFLKNAFFIFIFRTLRVINSGVNFFIYFFNGTRFREDTLNHFKFRSCRAGT